jgi:hypothetical protein
VRFAKVASVFLFIATISLSSAGAQAPQRTAAPARRAAPAAATAARPVATLAQLMKGILYPNANVIFFVQDKDPAKIKPAPDPSLSPDPLASTYGGWEAVENSGLALYEAANLLMEPGRKCSNGKAVPITNADWPKLVQGLRDAGLAVQKAAQAKNQDQILDVADKMTTACSNCHDKYREKPTIAARCQ